jgi:hypothetical protein
MHNDELLISLQALLPGSVPSKHRPRGLAQNDQVERQRPVVDVAQVELDCVLFIEIGSATDLPESGQTWGHETSTVGVVRHLCYFVSQMRSRAD